MKPLVKMTLSFIIAFVTLWGDQQLKHWIAMQFTLGEVRPFIPHVVALTYLQNTGAAYSILQNKMLFFYIISTVALVVIGYLIWRAFQKNHHILAFIALGLLLAGTLGNLIDRLNYHYVIDMFDIQFMNFAIFNLADAALTLGVILYAIFLIIFDRENDE